MFSIMRMLKGILFLLLFPILSLIFYIIEPSSKSSYTEVTNTKEVFDRWDLEHEDCSLPHGSTERKLAEAYEQALVALFEEHPEERDNPEYGVAYEKISRRLARNRPDHTPITA